MAELRDVELRGNVTAYTLRIVDACAQAAGKSRMEWAEPYLVAAAEREIHAATVLVNMVKGNPKAPDGGAE